MANISFHFRMLNQNEPMDVLVTQLRDWATEVMGYNGQLPDPDQVNIDF